MLTAGIDMGARTIKVLVLRDHNVVSKALTVAGFETKRACSHTMRRALEQAGATRAQLQAVAATGAGRKEVPDADQTVTDVTAAARAAKQIFPRARTVIDLGAEEGRAIRCNEQGKVIGFEINEKCAAGSGAFTEAMARALEVSLEELGPLSLQSTQAIPLNAQCTVFAESEMVSMIHNNVAKPDMARAVHDAIASRIVSLAHKVGYHQPVVLIGGMAKNVGFVDSLKKGLQLQELLVPDEPEYAGALGAALIAADQAKS